MSLTLELDDLSEDVYIVSVSSPLSFSELVYYVNILLGSRFSLDKNGFKILRNKNPLLFSFYVDLKENNNPSYIIANQAYTEHENTKLQGLFSGESETIETIHFLLKRLKQHNYFLISAEPIAFNHFDPQNSTRFSVSQHISMFNQKEQDLFQQVYYEKQS